MFHNGQGITVRLILKDPLQLLHHRSSFSGANSDPAKQLQTTILGKIEKLVITRHKLQEGLSFWGQNLYAEKDVEQSSQTLEKTKVFIESLQAYNMPGKLINLKYEADTKGKVDGLLSVLKKVHPCRI